MKSVLVLAMVVLGQSTSSARTDESNAVAGIMPEIAVQTGEFKAAHTVSDLLGETSARPYESIIPPDEVIEWEVYVPDNYNPDRPADLLIYISPTQKGSIPPQWKSLLDEHNLIWIGANKTGVSRLPARRRRAR
jgi:hypothetical protein